MDVHTVRAAVEDLFHPRDNLDPFQIELPRGINFIGRKLSPAKYIVWQYPTYPSQHAVLRITSHGRGTVVSCGLPFVQYCFEPLLACAFPSLVACLFGVYLLFHLHSGSTARAVAGPMVTFVAAMLFALVAFSGILIYWLFGIRRTLRIAKEFERTLKQRLS